MVDTAGNKLRRAREQKHLTLEDAARATKIRVQQLADLESDEYSNFANLAYARSYVANYSKFLRVDLRSYLEGFSDPGSFGLEDYQYLSAKPVGVYRIPYRRRSTRMRRTQRRQLLGATIGLAALVTVFIGWLLVVNIQRLGDLDQLTARQAARENASGANPTGTTPAEPATTVNVSAPAPVLSPAPAGELLSVPVVAPTGVLPVNAPAADTPTPTAAPADVPAQISIPALALATRPATAESAVLPLSGGGRAAPALLSSHDREAQPQKVVNDRPRGQ